MIRIINSLAARPLVARLLFAVVAVIAAACGNSDGKPGY